VFDGFGVVAESDHQVDRERAEDEQTVGVVAESPRELQQHVPVGGADVRRLHLDALLVEAGPGSPATRLKLLVALLKLASKVDALLVPFGDPPSKLVDVSGVPSWGWWSG
jgi:hypothetical protein